MDKNKKIALVLIIASAVAALSYYFLVVKPKKDNTPPVPDPSQPGDINTVFSGGASANASSPINKTAYANKDGVKVLNNDGTTYKTAKDGEWLGTINATGTKGGKPWYQLNSIRWVAQDLATIA